MQSQAGKDEIITKNALQDFGEWWRIDKSYSGK